MTCEHCGAKVVDGGQVCSVCGTECSAAMPESRPLGRVVPFRPKKRVPERAPSPKPIKRRRSPALWWIIAIVAVSLVLPYVLPLGR